jgi:hypothetical protein
LYQVLDELTEVLEKEELVKILKDSRDSLEGIGQINIVGGYQNKQFKAYMTTQISEKYLNIFKDIDLVNLQSISMLPKNTFFYFGGILPLSWEEIKEDFINENLQPDLEKNIEQVQNKIGVDIEKAIYSWPAKEFSKSICFLSLQWSLYYI